jgi:hypothetical protein
MEDERGAMRLYLPSFVLILIERDTFCLRTIYSGAAADNDLMVKHNRDVGRSVVILSPHPGPRIPPFPVRCYTVMSTLSFQLFLDPTSEK